MFKHDQSDHLKCAIFKHLPWVRWTSYPWQVTPRYEGAPMSTRSFILFPGLGKLAGFRRGSLRLWLWQLPQRMLWGGKVNTPGGGPRPYRASPQQNDSVHLHLISVSKVLQPLNTIGFSAPNFPSLSLPLSPTSWNLNPFHFLEEFRSFSLMQVVMFS